LVNWIRSIEAPLTKSPVFSESTPYAQNPFYPKESFQAFARQAKQSHQYCHSLSMPVLAPTEHAYPCAITLALPSSISAQALGEAALARNIQLGWQSGYLRARNWIQICLMVPHPEEDLAALQRVLKMVWGELAH